MPPGSSAPFNPAQVTQTGHVLSLLVHNSTLYVGGRITVSGGARRDLLAFATTTCTLLPWTPNVEGPIRAMGTAAKRCGRAMAVAGTTLYVGGSFTTMGATDRAGAAAFDWSSGPGTLMPWNPSMNGAVLDVLIDGARTVLGGEFTAPGAEVRRGVAIIDLNTGQLTPWRPRYFPSARARWPSATTSSTWVAPF